MKNEQNQPPRGGNTLWAIILLLASQILGWPLAWIFAQGMGWSK